MTRTQPVDPYAQHLGITVIGHGGGRAEATATVSPNHLNPHGTAHGAFIFTVAGAALAAAANDAEHSGVVSAVHIDYLRPGQLGDRLTAVARVAERLPKEDIFEIRISDDENNIVARVSGRANRRLRASSTAPRDRGIPHSNG
ncbi:acyl-CoA thioesterase [Saccharopolyspora kobensis]|uniref:Acyl-CoA thioesterase n=1 Tax=Saccharopolyspora kobensis TaxID=146035 RepID=A0A1H5URR0_9PSEU|nr:hotdog fold thioesterase [Saccharopolyspora kobensis]SEF77696.1 acyl-CoA thioesterase [Saccharopolyspora kobensis]SFC70292.1 acyl-CoA thioesterase [Saccharopolyspora kobensis]